MEITVIAKEQPRESFIYEGQQQYLEWGIGKINSQEERDKFVADYGVREIYAYPEPCASVRRMVYLNNGNATFSDWDILDFGDGLKHTAWRIGDTGYYRAVSVHPLHLDIVERSAKINKLQNELTELEYRINPCKFERKSVLSIEYEDKYIAELKSKRLYSKALKGEASDNVIGEMKNRLKREYAEEYNNISARIREIKEDLKVLSTI